MEPVDPNKDSAPSSNADGKERVEHGRSDRGQKNGRGKGTDKPSIIGLIILALLGLMGGVFQEFGNPFGVASALDDISANIYNNVMSPFYGEPETVAITIDKKTRQFDTRRGQKQIVVIMLDDSYLEDSGQSWPIPPQKFHRLLRNLANAGSAAIFFDIYFDTKDRDKEQEVAQLFSYAEGLQRDTGTPIVFAGTLSDPSPSANQQSAPDSALAQLDVDPGFYSFNIASADHKLLHPTAAWRLYQHWCARNTELCENRVPQNVQPEGRNRHGIDDLYIQWGAYPNEMATSVPEFGGENCKSQGTRIGEKIFESAAIILRDGTTGFRDDRSNVCTYTTQINLAVVNHLSAAEIKELFEHKVVMLGTSLKLYEDLHFSPAHGYVPGVFWHAMALDNMIEYGADYKRQVDPDLISYTVIVMLSIILIIQATIRHNLHNLHNPDFSEELEMKLRLRHSLFLICVISGVVLFTTGITNWAPTNWVGIALLALLIDASPVTFLPKYSWKMRPFRPPPESLLYKWQLEKISLFRSERANTALSESINIVMSAFVLFALIGIGFLIFILPHAVIGSRAFDQYTVAYTFLALYVVTATYSLIYFFRNK